MIPQCKGQVSHGRMGLFQCQNKPGPSGYCHSHDKAAKADARAALIREAIGPAEEEAAHDVRVTLRAKLAWPRGTGPRIPAAYQNRVVEVESVTVSTDLGDTTNDWSRVRVVAFNVKKDGTTGARNDADGWRLGALPLRIQADLIRLLDAEEERYRG